MCSTRGVGGQPCAPSGRRSAAARCTAGRARSTRGVGGQPGAHSGRRNPVFRVAGNQAVKCAAARQAWYARRSRRRTVSTRAIA